MDQPCKSANTQNCQVWQLSSEQIEEEEEEEGDNKEKEECDNSHQRKSSKCVKS